jgi:hypothetical protein
MQKDERDLVDVLKFELNFLEKGGYWQSPREPWRPQFIFEDSPTCMNYDSKSHPDTCDKCVLIQLVPPEFRDAKIPCRHIPFSSDGETLDSLYRYADQFEIEDIFGMWLQETIAKLENERKVHQNNSTQRPDPSIFNDDAVPLCRNLSPKCANPACPVAFHWLGGGKFFRFRPDGKVENSGRCVMDSRGNLHGVKHFWLCEHCSHIFTLVYEEKAGVLLRLRWPGLPPIDPPKEIPQTCGTGAKDLRQAAKV